MPSSTFFNLPPQKREKLLAAARAEFARIPYAHTSVNQIIRTAGIPRGSFYMYFRDKDELFSYLLGDYVCRVEILLESKLAEAGGDPFVLLPALYDLVSATALDPVQRTTYEDVLHIMDLNGTSVLGVFIEQATPSVLAVLRAGVNRQCLDLRGEEDLDDCMKVLLAVTASAMRDALLSADPTAVRRRFLNTLDILARGMTRRTNR